MTPDDSDLEKKAKVNPYIQRIHEYPQYIWPTPEPSEIQKQPFWNKIKNHSLHLDIGSGAGEFLMQLAEQNPQLFCIGFEVRYKRVVFSAEKYQKRNLENVMIFKERGERLFEYFEHEMIDHLYINFPDPWAKRKQHKHRMLSPTFLERLHPFLKPEGMIQHKTDHAEYFQYALKNIKSSKDYQILEETTDLYQSPYINDNIYTEFEGLFKAKHKPPIGHVKAIKVSS